MRLKTQALVLEIVGFVCGGLGPVPSAALPSSFVLSPVSTQEPSGQVMALLPPISPGPLETLTAASFWTWAQNPSTETCFKLDEFHKHLL